LIELAQHELTQACKPVPKSCTVEPFSEQEVAALAMARERCQSRATQTRSPEEPADSR
jgi:hypothetical protein